MRTGHGTKGSRHHDWATPEVTSDDAPGDHGTRDAGRSAHQRWYTYADTTP